MDNYLFYLTLPFKVNNQNELNNSTQTIRLLYLRFFHCSSESKKI